MHGPDWTYWLQMMNFAMVAVVVLAGATVLIPAFWALREKSLGRTGAQDLDQEVATMFRREPHRIHIPELGLTMADGGEELKSSNDESGNKDSRGGE